MKLKELFNNLDESLKNPLPINWTIINKVNTGVFELDDRMYEVEIIPTDFSEFKSTLKNAYEISFTGKNKNEDKSYQAPGGSSIKHSMTVFATIIDGVEAKLNTLGEISFIYFTAKKNDKFFKERVSLYNRLTRNLAARLNLDHRAKEYDKMALYILSLVEIDDVLIDKIEKLI